MLDKDKKKGVAIDRNSYIANVLWSKFTKDLKTKKNEKTRVPSDEVS